MSWLREAVEDGTTRLVSAKRVAMLIATFALAGATLALSLAALLGRDVAAALAAVSVPLAGLGGYSYVGAKSVEARRGA